jgi:hypothetical protein
MFRNGNKIFLAALAAVALMSDSAPAQPSLASCPATSNPITFGTGTLDTLVENKDGLEYVEDLGQGSLQLVHAGGRWLSTTLDTFELNIFTAVADFNGDGWDDFVGGDIAGYTTTYRNYSGDWLFSPDDWLDPLFILQTDFGQATALPRDATGEYHMILAAGDFDGDGRDDVFRGNSTYLDLPQSAEMWLNTGNDGLGNPTFAPPYNAIASDTLVAELGHTAWVGTHVVVTDYNGDRKLDLLVGSAEGIGGTINIFLNTCTSPASPPAAPALIPCTDNPKFSYAGPLVEDMDMGGGGPGEIPVFVYEDFDGDGLRDVIAGSPMCCTDPDLRLQMWRGEPGGGVELFPSQSIPFIGAATVVLTGDFSRDGLPDLVVGTDGNLYGSASNIGGKTFYYQNNGTATPFADGVTQQLSDYNAATGPTDFDTGFVFNYDNDPSNTPDIMISDGNSLNTYYIFANRIFDEYVDCGEASSGIVDLGPLAATEMVVNSARLKPTVQLNGGTVKWYMSNENPPNWVEAVDCGDASGDVCATFPKPVGREIRWKVVMCSNATKSQSPQLTGLNLRFDYTQAKQHLRSGVVISDGVAYVGTFSQPGDRGRMYAMAAGLNQTYWEFGAVLDAMSDSDRNIYTATSSGTSRLDFRWTGNPTNDNDLTATLGAADGAQAQSVVDWVRSARFGLAGTGVPQTKLGGVETSTPAVVNKPGLPLWYTMSGTDDRAAVDAFIAAKSDRIPLVVFGAKDGMVHAARNDATNITDVDNGKEMWAFVPGKVASGMVKDYSDSQGGALTVASFPDGSPTVADIKLGGALSTVAVIGSGNGGSGVAAIDITETVDPVTSAVSGPTPLWHAVPGGADAGPGFAKPVLARVNIGGTERFIAIAGSGIRYGNNTKGRMVVAYDMADGSPLWKFQAKCPVTSHLAVFETDDDAEPGTPKIDGFMDRVVFADYCGYVYKLNPARDLGGGWNDNEFYGSMPVDMVDGKQLYALFTTTHTDALGNDSNPPEDLAATPAIIPGQRPIAGTIGVRVDSTGRVVLYFGTGGMEEYDPTYLNEFYAVYADNGMLRSKLTGTCVSGKCEKFYGGVVVTTEQVIYTRSTDRQVGSGVCDSGTTMVQALRINADVNNDFVIDFSAPIASAAVGSLYGDAGAVYLATLAGDIVRVGTPRATAAGEDTANGNMGGQGAGEAGTTGTNEPLVLMGWRQIF